MLSIETIRQILKNPKISDEKAELIRDEMRSLAEIVAETFINNKIEPDIREKLRNENN